MANFYPALAHTDNIGFFDSDGRRRTMSIRGLMPESISHRFLTSLSFDEEIHYAIAPDDGDPESGQKVMVTEPTSIFVDCGAFHYKDERVPRFKMGGFANAITSFEQYSRRHLSRGLECEYLLCSPDHIIPPGCDDETALARREFTLANASVFIDLAKTDDRVTPVGVVHGRTMEERSEMTGILLDMGYDYIAFGGLVPLSRDQGKVLSQLAGPSDPNSPRSSIIRGSPLGLAKSAGAKTHLFGLNSPDWYRWIKRLGVDSFDGSKLSTEGAVNGIIWVKGDKKSGELTDAKGIYRRMMVKKIGKREAIRGDGTTTFQFSEDGILHSSNPGLDYLMTSRCTSPKCPHGPEVHCCDPRVTGSTEHNMGRAIHNSWIFEWMMSEIDGICEEAKSSEDGNLRENWSPIEVEA